VVNGTLTALIFLRRDSGRAKIADASGLPESAVRPALDRNAWPLMLSGEGNVKIRILVRLCLEGLGVITRELTATARRARRAINCNCEKS
jgi:hypothetical protein